MTHAARSTLLLLVLAGAVASAGAQEAPAERAPNAARAAATADDADDDMTLRVTAGSAISYGNARNITLNLGAAFAIRRGVHAFAAELGWVYGLTATRIDPDGTSPDNTFGDLVDNANNLTGRLRYDLYFDPETSFFLAALGRRDPFARLEPRLSAQTGILRNIFREEDHRFWGELGFDFTYDRFGDVPLAVGGTDDMGNPTLSTDRGVGALRVFIGYNNQLNDSLTYRTGFEWLWGPLRTVGSDATGAMRFEWVNQFTSKIEDWLQLSIDITGRLDSLPPGQESPFNEQANQATQMFDLLATLNLVGNFDLDGEPEEAAEE
jgi:hypothetical protein